MTNTDFSYRKNDNKHLFANFEDNTLLNVSKPQNYIPLYNTFFSINSTNYNTINLNQHFTIKSIDTHLEYNKYEGILEEQNDTGFLLHKRNTVFFKFSPLIDPIKYINS
jgi:hypothetical protein